MIKKIGQLLFMTGMSIIVLIIVLGKDDDLVQKIGLAMLIPFAISLVSEYTLSESEPSVVRLYRSSFMGTSINFLMNLSQALLTAAAPALLALLLIAYLASSLGEAVVVLKALSALTAVLGSLGEVDSSEPYIRLSFVVSDQVHRCLDIVSMLVGALAFGQLFPGMETDLFSEKGLAGALAGGMLALMYISQCYRSFFNLISTFQNMAVLGRGKDAGDKSFDSRSICFEPARLLSCCSYTAVLSWGLPFLAVKVAHYAWADRRPELVVLGVLGLVQGILRLFYSNVAHLTQSMRLLEKGKNRRLRMPGKVSVALQVAFLGQQGLTALPAAMVALSL